MATEFIIGIDGGGTKTCGRIERLNSGEYFEETLGPASLTNDFNGALSNIKNLLINLITKVNCTPEQVSVVIGVAGGGVKSQTDKLLSSLNPKFAFLSVYNDAKTSLYGANNGKPVAVVALGTGSVGARLDADGNEHYAGGWGFPIGDDGGGAKLGFHAVQTLLQELDLNEQPTSLLSQTLFASLNHSRDHTAEWLKVATPAQYAEFCPMIFALANKCDIAQQLIKQHALHCEELITATRQNSNAPIILLGGLANSTLPYLHSTTQKAKGTSLDGACYLAKQQMTAVNQVTAKKNVNTQSTSSTNTIQEQTLLQQLDRMISEGRNPNTMDIDLMSSQQILEVINNEDQKVPIAVKQCIKPLSNAVDAIVEAFKSGGRLVYIGAGTSGRLGILDAVECPPTFSVPPEQVVGIIAGGNKAIHKAVEGAEDNVQLGADDLKNIDFNKNDVLVGIAASGRTPYVIGALDYADHIGATTVALSCNPNSDMERHAQITINPVVGPEVVTGSTRLKSGTAQKLVLNMLTTAAMIRSGKTYENLMVDVNASNKKLYMRAIRIVMQATQCDANTAEKALKITDFSVKTAILHILTGISPEGAEDALKQNNGFLRSAVDNSAN